MRTLLLLLSLLALPDPAGADVRVFAAQLDGSQITPPVNTPGHGEALITFDLGAGHVHVQGYYDELIGDVFAMHLHGSASTTPGGSILIHLHHSGGTRGTFEGAGVLDADGIQDLLDFKGYVNVHTSHKQGGEIRGNQVWPVAEFSARASGSQVVPPAPSAGSGTIQVALDPNSRDLLVEGSYSALGGDLTAAHLRGPAPLGQEGPILGSLSHSGGTDGQISGSLQLGPQDFAAAQAGLVYLEFESVLHPAGELRAQLDDGLIGTLYCSPWPNSTGQAGSIQARGQLAVSANDLTLRAGNLPPNTSAYFLAGMGSEQSLVFLDGPPRLCLLGAPIARFSRDVFHSGPHGSGSLAVDLSALPFSPPVAAMAGQTWNFQCWYRDAASSQVSSNFTNAASLTLQ